MIAFDFYEYIDRDFAALLFEAGRSSDVNDFATYCPIPDEVLCGGRGNDTLTGGAGADHFDGGQGSDSATDFNQGEGDTETDVP